MFSLIPKIVKNIWDKDNIRGVILFSLFLQCILIFFAPLRKRTQSAWTIFPIWISYQLADWAANYCVGLISDNTKDDVSNDHTYLMAFWAPFLLLHLGGPDTITALALEDNQLWLRHLLGLIAQAIAAAYVFSLTLPTNNLWIPTLLVFVAGIIKYAERTRALYLGSINVFRQSLIPKPDPGPNYAKLMKEHHCRKEVGLPTRIEISKERDRKSRLINGHGAGEKLNELQVVHKAYDFFVKFKGLIVDMILSFRERNESFEYFVNKDAEDTFRIIEVELNFMYEAFFTKVSVVRHWLGYIFRFVSFSSIMMALGLFIAKNKHGFNMFDIRVTYALLYGAVALDFVAILMIIFSDRTAVYSVEAQKESYKDTRIKRFIAFVLKHFAEKVLVHYLRWKSPTWSKCEKEPYIEFHALCRCFLFRRWSRSISGLNFITYCLDKCPKNPPEITTQVHGFNKVIQRIRLWLFKTKKLRNSFLYGVIDYIGAKDLLETRKYKKNNPFLKELWELIFRELQMKSKAAQRAEEDQQVEIAKKIYSARGELVFQRSETLDSEEIFLPFVDPNEVAFDESLMLWHIATHLCDADDQNNDKDTKVLRELSKLLSDYMLYLLIMQPTMMSAVAGIAEIRYQDTCAEAIKFFSKMDTEPHDQNEKEACKQLIQVHTDILPIEVKGDRSKSLLFDACRLAKELIKLEEKKKWEIICQVWVELLSFAASNIRPTTNVQQLSKGGELISFVWLLMIHLGLGRQFQVKEGHARAKLIVG